MSPVVVLVGVPGSGKSTVGNLLARELNVGFSDTDVMIEAAEGRSVSDVFINSGEEYFREVESRVAAAALDAVEGVLALGGGSILNEQTRLKLADHKVVWLRVKSETAVRRVGLNAPRPVLLGNVRGQMTKMMNDRTPLYEAVASSGVVENDGDNARAAADAVRELLVDVDGITNER